MDSSLKKLFGQVKRERRMKRRVTAGTVCFSNGNFRVEYLLGLLLEFLRNFYSFLGKVWGIGFATRDARLLQAVHSRFSTDAAVGGFVYGEFDYSALEWVIADFLATSANPSFQFSVFNSFNFERCDYKSN
jgi:hypothetical protein